MRLNLILVGSFLAQEPLEVFADGRAVFIRVGLGAMGEEVHAGGHVGLGLVGHVEVNEPATGM